MVTPVSNEHLPLLKSVVKVGVELPLNIFIKVSESKILPLMKKGQEVLPADLKKLLEYPKDALLMSSQEHASMLDLAVENLKESSKNGAIDYESAKDISSHILKTRPVGEMSDEQVISKMVADAITAWRRSF